MSFKIVNNNDVPLNYCRYNICKFVITSGGITPKYQPVDSFIGKVSNIHYGYYYDSYTFFLVNKKGKKLIPSTIFFNNSL